MNLWAYLVRRLILAIPVIVGVTSHRCVDAATRAAYDLGLRCMLVHDPCAIRDLAFGGKGVAAEEVPSWPPG